MKLTENQFLEAAFIFERNNGYKHGEFEKGMIANSELIKFSVSELKDIIIDGLEKNLYQFELELRTSAYWSLMKTYDDNLKPRFQNWLKFETEFGESIPVFQLLIALDYLDENVFPNDDETRDASESEKNLNTAKNYLSKI